MTKHKPAILISFDDQTVVWLSSGWGDDAKLMAAAKSAINRGKDEPHVIRLLEAAGFEVIKEEVQN